MGANTERVLITGATGTLGRHVVSKLSQQGMTVSVLTRESGDAVPPGIAVCRGDLTDRSSIGQALRKKRYIIHAASNPQDSLRVDLQGTENLLESLQKEEVAHFIYVSIAGVDRSSYPYYQTKRMVEEMVARSGIPWTVLRATQFHDMVLNRMIRPFDAGPGNPVRIPRGMRFQPVDVRDVALRLQQLLREGPALSTITLGGPEVLTIEEMAGKYLEAQKRHDPVRPESLTGAIYDLFRSGVNIGREWERGRITWEEFLKTVVTE